MNTRILKSQGGVKVLPISRWQLEIAGKYFAQPIVRHTEPLTGTLWKRELAEAALERLDAIGQWRNEFQISFGQLGTYINNCVFRNRRVLELGCGLSLRQTLASAFRGEWIALDHNSKLIQAAHAKHPKGSSLLGSAYQLPLRDNSVATVFSHNFFDVIFDPEETLKEAMRVLVPGGFILHLLDIIACDTQIERQMLARGFGTVKEQGSLLSFLGAPKTTDELRLLPCSSNSGRAETRKQPLLTYSLLSMAQVLKALQTFPQITRVENGVVASMTKRDKGAVPDFLINNASKLRWIFREDCGSFQNVIAENFFAARSLLTRLGLARGLEIYVADFILAQKAA